MFWITCSSQSTRHAKKPCASVDASRRAAFAAALLTFATLFTAPAIAAKNLNLVSTAFAPTGVFNSIEMASIGVAPIANWDSVQGRLQKERKLVSRCLTQSEACPKTLRDWQSKIVQWRDLAVIEQVTAVNRFANRAIRYTDDRKTFKKSDYWATPMQSLRGRGDCEDYVLLKYETLLALGFAKQDLRIVVVMDQRKNIAHAVLSVKTEAGTLILDNQDQRVLRHDAIRHYAPLYSINEKGRWTNIATRAVKPRREAPMVLLASAKAQSKAKPFVRVKSYAVAAKAAVIPVPVLVVLPVLKTPIARLQAVAAASLLHMSISVAEREPKPYQKPASVMQDYLTPLVKLLTGTTV